MLLCHYNQTRLHGQWKWFWCQFWESFMMKVRFSSAGSSIMAWSWARWVEVRSWTMSEHHNHFCCCFLLMFWWWCGHHSVFLLSVDDSHGHDACEMVEHFCGWWWWWWHDGCCFLYCRAMSAVVMGSIVRRGVCGDEFGGGCGLRSHCWYRRHVRGRGELLRIYDIVMTVGDVWRVLRVDLIFMVAHVAVAVVGSAGSQHSYVYPRIYVHGFTSSQLCQVRSV